MGEINKLLLPIDGVPFVRRKSGQSSSVLCALESAPQDARAVMIALSDQPLLTVEDLADLQDAYLALEHRSEPIALVPCVNGQRGNPVVLSRALVDTLIDQRTPPRAYLDQHPEVTIFKNFTASGFIVDIDNPAQWAEFLANQD